MVLFVDYACPLCSREVSKLKALDTLGKLTFEDIHDTSWHRRYPHINPQQCLKVLHGIDDFGQPLLGLDVTVAAWRSVGRGHWVNWLRWPLVKPITDLGYRHFARHRHRLGLWLGPAPSQCEGDVCRRPNK